MNFDDTPEEAAFRREARAWLDANAPFEQEAMLRRLAMGQMDFDDEFLALSRAWQKKKYDAGWACLSWPTEYGGRGASPMESVIWGQEEGIFSMLSVAFFMGHGMCGPTLMAHGTEEQKRRYLPPMASGEEIWCQLFSEPAGGSDLAGLRTRAVREEESGDWIVNGQKVWTSYAHFADHAILLTRTDVEVPKHKGLTMFFLAMETPGLDVRPIRQASGQSEFNEEFFTDVRIPDSQRLGAIDDGWRVSLATLMNERMAVGAGLSTGFEELLAFCRSWPTGTGAAIADPRVRSHLAQWAVRASGLKYTGYRTISALSKGEQPGPEESIGKLVRASMAQEMASFALDVQGAAGVLTDPVLAPMAGRFQAMLMRSPGLRIEGGTDEILRNIIAERVLGLPADIRVDKDIPFNKIPARGR